MEKFEAYVAVFDILGFREMIKNESLEVVREKISAVTRTLSERSITDENRKNPNFGIQWFSDTIFLVIPVDDFFSPERVLVFLSSEIYRNLTYNNIPTKGSIAFGEVIIHRDKGISMLMGKPVVDAFEMQEDLKLMGLAFHHSAEIMMISRLQESTFPDAQDIVKNCLGEYLCPFSFGSVKTTLLHWFITSVVIRKNGTMIPRDPIIHLQKAYDFLIQGRMSCSGKPRIYYDNTEKYYQEIANKHGIILTSDVSKKGAFAPSLKLTPVPDSAQSQPPSEQAPKP